SRANASCCSCARRCSTAAAPASGASRSKCRPSGGTGRCSCARLSSSTRDELRILLAYVDAMTLQNLHLLLGSSHTCGYLPQRTARSAFVDPTVRLEPMLYGALLDQGFRRSGNYAHRPMCLLCRACRSVRIPVATFAPNR